MLPNDRIFLVDGETILKGSRLTAIAVRERRDTNVSRRDRVQLDRREKRVIGGALPYLHHLPETKRKKDPSDRIFWVDGGTFGFKHEPDFNHKRKKLLDRKNFFISKL